jgi:hypothetical protein
MSANRYLPSGLALLGYVVLAVLMTWPLVPQLSTYAAGKGNDMWVFRWNDWWLRKALVEGHNPYHTSYLFYPHGVSLLWHSFSWLNTGLWLPLQVLVGPLAAHNLIVLLTYTLSGYTAYLLAHEITNSRKAAFVAGLVYAFYPYRIIHRNQIKFLSVQWIPLFALYLVRLTRRGRLRDGLKAGVMLALCGLSSVQLMALSGMWAVLWLAYSLVTERRDWTRRTVLALLLGGLVCGVLLAPFFAPMVKALVGPDAAQNLATGDAGEGGGTDALAFFVPSRHHPLLRKGELKRIYKRVVHLHGDVAAVGYTTLGLGAWAVVKRWRKARFWLLSALPLAALALGSTVHINGQALPGIPMPYRLLAPTLLGETIRHPARFNLILALPVTMLMAIGLADLLKRLRSRRQWTSLATIGVATLVLFEYFSLFQTTEPIHSAFYDQLRQEAGEFAVADFPIGFHAHDKWYMYAQTIHGRPMVGGHVSRVPAHAHDFMDNVPLLSTARVSAPKEGELGDVTRQLRLLAEAGVRYVLIHKDRASSDSVARWREWFVVHPCYEDEYLLVFRTSPRYGEDSRFQTEVGDGIGVLSATLLTEVLPQGGLLEAEVVWGTREPPERDWMAYLALVGPAGQEAQRADFEPYLGWPMSDWGRDAVARGRGTLQVDPFIPGGTYTVTLGLADPVTGVSLGEPIEVGRVEVQTIERVFEVPEAEVESEAVFGEALRLLGYDLHLADDQAQVRLHWQALQRMDVPYKFFVHLVDPVSGQLVAQADVMPHNWTYPTTWWEVGEVVSDEIVLPLIDVPPGIYRLEMGVYHPDSGDRLPLTDGHEPQKPSDRFILLEAVEVH